jgi:hypothetical protein
MARADNSRRSRGCYHGRTEIPVGTDWRQYVLRRKVEPCRENHSAWLAFPCSFTVGIGFGPANHGEPPETPAGHIFDCTQDVLPIACSPKEGHLASFRPRARIIYAEFALPVGNHRGFGGERSASSSMWRSAARRILGRTTGSALGLATSSRRGSRGGRWSGSAKAHATIAFRPASVICSQGTDFSRPPTLMRLRSTVAYPSIRSVAK